jgi:hypothetical protein
LSLLDIQIDRGTNYVNDRVLALPYCIGPVKDFDAPKNLTLSTYIILGHDYDIHCAEYYHEDPNDIVERDISEKWKDSLAACRRPWKPLPFSTPIQLRRCLISMLCLSKSRNTPQDFQKMTIDFSYSEIPWCRDNVVIGSEQLNSWYDLQQKYAVLHLLNLFDSEDEGDLH